MKTKVELDKNDMRKIIAEHFGVDKTRVTVGAKHKCCNRKSTGRPIHKQPKQKTVSNCITAREDRGISNQRSVGNGVLEWEKNT